MTLLEAVIAFVVLAVVGIACLDQSRGASQLQHASSEWTRAVSRGESLMAQAVSGVTAPIRDATITRRAWARGVDAIEVTITLPSGAHYVTSRLVPAAGTATR